MNTNEQKHEKCIEKTYDTNKHEIYKKNRNFEK